MNVYSLAYLLLPLRLSTQEEATRRSSRPETSCWRCWVVARSFEVERAFALGLSLKQTVKLIFMCKNTRLTYEMPHY